MKNCYKKVVALEHFSDDNIVQENDCLEILQ